LILTPCPPLPSGEGGLRKDPRESSLIDARLQFPLSAYAERGTGGEDNDGRGETQGPSRVRYPGDFPKDATAGAGDWYVERRDRWHWLYVEGKLALREPAS